MEHRLAFGLINGYLNHPLSNWSLRQIIPLNFPELVTLLIPWSVNGKQIGWGKFFYPPKVQSILSIFLSSCLPQDEVVWAYIPKEKFTVHSAYKIALDKAMNSRVGEPSNDDTIENSGEKFGAWTCRIRWSLMLGEHAEMYFPQKQTYAECMWSLLIRYRI